MKRILSLLICLTVVISSLGAVGFASESDHWAYNDVKALVNDGVVSGDQNGNLNLDNKITRAEFIKTVNKYFGFTKKASENFKDVAEGSWYYEDMAIAKGEGYVKGDDKGNANPDMSITRAEASVIIARLLNLEEATDCEFADKDSIPDWALGSIGALYKKGIINGYSDGTFKAENSISRAEAFVIIKRNEKPSKEEPVVTPQDKPVASGGGSSFIPSGGGSGGGGGGGSSSGGITQTYVASLSKRDFDRTPGQLEFQAWNAASYKIMFTFANGFYEDNLTLLREDGTYKYADYASFKSAVLQASGTSSVDAKVFVKAIGLSGYSDSEYVEFGSARFKLDIPEVTGVSVSNNPAGDWAISWDSIQNITEYKVTLFSDKALETEYKKYEGLTSTTHTVSASELGNIGDVFYVTVSAKVESFYGVCDTYSATLTNGFDGGMGTKESPYIISTVDQFKKTFSNQSPAPNTKDTYYLLTGFDQTAMVLTGYTPMDVLNANITGGDMVEGVVVPKVQKINFGTFTTNASKYVADGDYYYQGVLFNDIKDATVENLSIEGTVTVSEVKNGLFGTLAGRANNAVINNITANVNITSSLYSGNSATAGIIGALQGTAKITNCKNYGDVTNIKTFAYCVTGIVGKAPAGVTVENCVNYGDITAKNEASGIIGWSANNTITNCANYGYIKVENNSSGSYFDAGGVIARAGGDITLNKCFNAGSIYSKKYAGGLVGIVGSTKVLNVNDSYNLGNIQGDSACGLVVGENQGALNVKRFYDIGNESVMSVAGVKGTLTVENAYSYSKTESTEANDVSKVSADYIMNLLNNDSSFASSVWGANENYSYPGLIENAIENGNTFINIKVTVTGIAYDINERKWIVTIEPTGKGIADSYKAYIDGIETVLSRVTDKEYSFVTETDSSAAVVVEAIANNQVIDTSDTYTANFNLKKLAISDVKRDKDSGKWFITFTKSGKGIADLYKLFAGSEELTIEQIEETKYEILTPPSGIAALTLKAYAGNDLIDESTAFEADFSLSKVSIDSIAFDYSKEAWAVAINPQDGATKYVLYVNGNNVYEALAPSDKLIIPDSVTGKGKVVVKAYKNEEFLAETLESDEYDFTFAGGLGTSDKPYIIATADQFKKAFAEGNQAYILAPFILGSDITLDGTYKPSTSIYKGVFDGKNHKVTIATVLTTSDNVDKYQGGLFHKLDAATVKNLEILGTVTSSTDISGTSYLGGLTGYLGNSSTLENIVSRVAITSAQDYATAGLAGAAGGGTNKIINSSNYGSVNGKKNTAGIIGDKFRTTMYNCYNYGEITGTLSSGGLVGENKDNAADTITKCGNYGDVTATNGVAGGIAGWARKPIEESFNAGKITASTYAGGIIGEIASGKTGNITNCFNVGKISGGTASGTAIGNLVGTSTVKNYYDIANPEISSPVGNKTGTLNVTNVYGYSDKDTIKDLESTFGALWTKNAGYDYPDLINNSIVLNNKNNVVLP